MKKLLFLLLFLIGTQITYAQQPTTTADYYNKIRDSVENATAVNSISHQALARYLTYIPGLDSMNMMRDYVQKTRTINGYPLSANIILSKVDVGLGNADNTSDLNKPVSVATQNALAGKINTADTGLGKNIVTATSVIPAARSAVSVAAGSNTVVNYDPTTGIYTINGVGAGTGGHNYKAGYGLGISDTTFKLDTTVADARYTTGAALNAKFSSTGVSVPTLVTTEIAQPVNRSICIYNDITSTFSGHGWAIPNYTGWNALVYQYRTRATPVTRIARCLRQGSSTGAVIYADSITVTTTATTVYTDTFSLPSVYTGTDTLYFQFACNQFIDNFSAPGNGVIVVPPYAANSYRTGGVINFSSPWTSVVSGQHDFWFDLIYNTVTYAPSKTFVNSVYALADSPKADHQKISAIYPAVTNALQNGFCITKSQTFYSGGSIQNNTSTFNGWGGVAGVPDSFNAAYTIVHAQETNSGNITIATMYVIDSTNAGTVLGTATDTGLSIAPGVTDTVWFVFPSTIKPTRTIWVGYAANNHVGMFAGSQVFTHPPYALPFYTTGVSTTVNPATWAQASSNYNVFVGFGYGAGCTVLSPTTLRDAASRLGIPSTVANLVTANINLTSTIFCTEGVETNLYWEDFITSSVPVDQLQIDVASTKGVQNDRNWRYQPTAADSGMTTLEVDVLYQGRAITSKTVNVYTSKATTASGKTAKGLTGGDSQTVNGFWQDSLRKGTNPAITLVGTQGAAPTLNEGYSGEKWPFFAIKTVSPFYKFTVSGITTVPTVGATYTNNGTTFTVQGQNVTGGAGDVEMSITTGTNAPLASGTLTKTSGTGDATITFSSNIFYSNPFWNTGTNKFDFQNYLTTNSLSLSSGDFVSWMLGTNDYFGVTNFAALDIATIGYVDTVINGIQAAVPGIPIVLMLPPSGNDYQSAFGANYSTGVTAALFRTDILHYDSLIIATYDNSAYQSRGIYVISTNAVVDCKYNMQHATVAVNQYNTAETITVGTNGVHPSIPGYLQIWSQIRGFLKWLFR